MASSGQRNKQTVRGTDGNDFAYRQTIDTKYNAASSSKQTLVNLTVMGTVIACFVAVIALAQAYRVFIISGVESVNDETYLFIMRILCKEFKFQFQSKNFDCAFISINLQI